jgi:putative transposase
MGAFVQNRYKSIVCQEDAYLLELVRYIHLNLLRAGLVKTIDDLNRSPFSGHSACVTRSVSGEEAPEKEKYM